MFGKSNAIRVISPVLALAVAAGLALAGCGGNSSSIGSGGNASGGNASGGNPSGGSNGAACAAFTTAYKKFLTGYAPPESQTGTDESPLEALAAAVTKVTASGQLQRDLSNLGIDADLIASGSSEGGYTTPPSAFYSDLQAVGKDCGTTFTKPRASLVQEG